MILVVQVARGRTKRLMVNNIVAYNTLGDADGDTGVEIEMVSGTKHVVPGLNAEDVDEALGSVSKNFVAHDLTKKQGIERPAFDLRQDDPGAHRAPSAMPDSTANALTGAR